MHSPHAITITLAAMAFMPIACSSTADRSAESAGQVDTHSKAAKASDAYPHEERTKDSASDNAPVGETQADKQDDNNADAKIYTFTLKRIDGQEESLSAYRGKTLLLVNVASKCGYTPQYEGLQKLYTTYQDRGLVVLGFPANNFGNQEPGTNEEIQTFCTSNYGVTFPMFSKISVKGEDQHPLYAWLTGKTGSEIGWNFTKFLIAPDGQLVGRFESKVKPMSPELRQELEKTLGDGN